MTLVELILAGETKPITKLYMCSIAQIEHMAKRRGMTILQHATITDEQHIQMLRDGVGWKKN